MSAVDPILTNKVPIYIGSEITHTWNCTRWCSDFEIFLFTLHMCIKKSMATLVNIDGYQMWMHLKEVEVLHFDHI